MAPTLLHGDRVLVVPVHRFRVGDLVVVRDPTDDERLVIKRVAGLPGDEVGIEGLRVQAGDGLVVLGDNLDASTDSRHYGRVQPQRVEGRAWYRYAPADRVGMLRRPPRVRRRAVDPRPG